MLNVKCESSPPLSRIDGSEFITSLAFTFDHALPNVKFFNSMMLIAKIKTPRNSFCHERSHLTRAHFVIDLVQLLIIYFRFASLCQVQ